MLWRYEVGCLEVEGKEAEKQLAIAIAVSVLFAIWYSVRLFGAVMNV